MKDVMLDLETLGINNNAVIAQIGACYFNRYSGKVYKKILIDIDAETSIRKGFEISASTIYWWLNQSQEARDSIIKCKKIPVEKAINKINTFLKDAECIWSHATFDYVKLLNHFDRLNIKPTFHYRTPRDLRTLTDAADINPRDYEFKGVAHNALADCLHQVKYTVDCINKIYKKDI